MILNFSSNFHHKNRLFRCTTLILLSILLYFLLKLWQIFHFPSSKTYLSFWRTTYYFSDLRNFLEAWRNKSALVCMLEICLNFNGFWGKKVIAYLKSRLDLKRAVQPAFNPIPIFFGIPGTHNYGQSNDTQIIPQLQLEVHENRGRLLAFSLL